MTLGNWFSPFSRRQVFAAAMTSLNTPGSTGRRNASLNRSQHLVKDFRGRPPAERLARSGVERRSHGREIVRAVRAQVGALREVLPQQPVGVLVRPALPRAVRIAEVDRHASVDPQLCVPRHFRSLVPGQRPSDSPFAKSRGGQSPAIGVDEAVEHQADRGQGDHGFRNLGQRLAVLGQAPPPAEPAERPLDHPTRSEEHTSELQSRQYLVCRLLLEKKKYNTLSLPTSPTYSL